MLSLFKTGRTAGMAFLASVVTAHSQEASPLAAPAPAQDPVRFAKVSPLGKVPDWYRLKDYAGTFTREEFEAAWKEIYAPETGLPPPFEITPTALQVPTGDPTEPTFTLLFRPSSASNEVSRPEVSWRRVSELPPLRGRPPLSDLHIALDPGHIGGQWARMEERFLSFRPGESIQEGDMSLLTARVLSERLQALGARVTLVRENSEPVTEERPADLEQVARATLKQHGILTPQMTYAEVQGDAKILTVQWQTEKLFYRVSEIHARADKVNNKIKPDIVLCLHFNAESWGAAEAPQFSPENHLHVLVNGCYAPVELEQQDVRYEMLTRLLNRVHEDEIPLAAAVAQGMAQSTGLPAYIYRTPNARKAGTSPYVYARNLLANRLYQCPVVYLEPYVMNHEETYRRLLMGHFVGRTLIGGKLQSSAIEDYVKGVVQGLVSYYETQRRSS